MGDKFARQHQRLWEVGAHRVEIVQHGKHRAPLAVPAPHHADQIGDGSRINRGKGFVQ